MNTSPSVIAVRLWKLQTSTLVMLHGGWSTMQTCGWINKHAPADHAQTSYIRPVNLWSMRRTNAILDACLSRLNARLKLTGSSVLACSNTDARSQPHWHNGVLCGMSLSITLSFKSYQSALANRSQSSLNGGFDINGGPCLMCHHFLCHTIT